MAPSREFYVWVGAGRPYALMRPAAALQRILRGHGLTVYDYPDEGHLRASTPEDHTPFSATGWPVKSAFGIGHGLDVMPRSDTAAGRAENAAIARQLIKDRDAGVSGVLWIKYINWTDERGVCRQERWMDAAHPLARTTRSSTDKGHIHISGRSDCDTDARADTYDPLAPDGEDNDMAIIAQSPTGQLYLCIGGFSHPITQANLADIKYVAGQGAYTLTRGPGDNAEWTGGGWIRKGWSEAVFGPVWREPAAATGGVDPAAVAALVAEQLDAVADKVADKLASRLAS